MAFANDLNVSMIGFVAGGTITANSMVKLDTTTGQVVAATAITDPVIGVSVDTATAAGQHVKVQMFGVAKVRYGATITVGQELMVKAAGTGELDVAAGATAFTCAKALEGGASGDTCAVLLCTPVRKGPANT